MSRRFDIPIGDAVHWFTPLTLGALRKGNALNEMKKISKMQNPDDMGPEEIEAMFVLAKAASCDPESFEKVVDDMDPVSGATVLATVLDRVMRESGFIKGSPKIKGEYTEGEAQGSQVLTSPESTGSPSPQPAGPTQ